MIDFLMYWAGLSYLDHTWVVIGTVLLPHITTFVTVYRVQWYDLLFRNRLISTSFTPSERVVFGAEYGHYLKFYSDAKMVLNSVEFNVQKRGRIMSVFKWIRTPFEKFKRPRGIRMSK